MPRFRIIDATQGIPKGLEIEVDQISTGTAIEKEINGNLYRFVVDGISVFAPGKFKVFNSNAIAIIEVSE